MYKRQGIDSFEYEVCDDSGACDVAEVRIEILFAKDAFNDFSNTTNNDDSGRISPSLLSRQIQSLAPNLVFSGQARPGSVITSRIYDQTGRVIGTSSGRADIGGNWMIHLHGLNANENYRVELEQVSDFADIYNQLVLGESNATYQVLQQVTTRTRSVGVDSASRTASDDLLQTHNKNNFGQGFMRE